MTEEEEIYYANNSLIDICDCCGDYFPIYDRKDEKDFLTLDGTQILCNECLEKKI